MEAANRRLIRPTLVEPKEQPKERRANPSGLNAAGNNKKQVPPEHTNAENFYYVKQMQSKTPMVIVLKDGESLHGVIEWYDKSCLKLNRDEGPNLLIYKPSIKYMYKA
ncbi:MAG: RNA chaperone Hfq [Bryobacteraceae bacterium]|nr:RNA chaperone Hfq [Bryobacteraceae bacterium]